MSELNFKQITDKLNAEFTGDVRKLIFWYDENAEFQEDVDGLELVNAKVYLLRPDNQFQTKIFLERVDTTTNYLVYAPFPKPPLAENHLADTIRYSREFFADRASLLVLDLNMDERCKPVIQHYIRFFNSKERTRAFYDLEITGYNRSTIEVGLMAVLCKCKVPSFEEVIRCVLTDEGFEDNRYLESFASYDLVKPFWQQCELLFGYADENHTLEKLVMTTFVTYAQKVIHTLLPAAWQPFVSFKSGNCIAFLDNLMNSVLYAERFDALSADIFRKLDAGNAWEKLGAEALADCNLFAGVDDIVLKWMIDRLLGEDYSARLNGNGIQALCEARRRMHFGKASENAYNAIENALLILSEHKYDPKSDINAVIQYYLNDGWKIDACYRRFILAIDRLEGNPLFEPLQDLVQRVYTNERLNPLASNYAAAFIAANAATNLPRQLDFYSAHVRYAKERVVVIISDALRYEVGQALFAKLTADEKCAVTLNAMQSVLPSVTRLGMAALLPHRNYTVLDADHAMVDELPTIDLPQREAALQKARPLSRAVQFDEIRGMSVEQLRGVCARQEVVYVYHNQIDARGDKFNTQNEVFNACEEAVDEIAWLIRRLTTSANTSRFIVTADHGFIYKREKLTDGDKIGGVSKASQRYAIAATPETDGCIGSVPLSAITGGEDSRVVNFPLGSDLFKAPGSGQNYVHGGCSPQEMIIPLLKVKTEKAHKETEPAKIALVSLLNKITNLIATLDFVQTEPISDVVKAAKYRIYFITDSGEKISSENQHVADSKEKDTSKRVFRMRFSFKNQRYDNTRRYYLVAIDDKTEMEVFRHEVQMDIAFAGDFGF